MWAAEGVDVATWPPPRPIGLLFSMEAIAEVAMSTIIHSYPCPCCHGRVSVFRFLGLLLTKRQKCCELLLFTSSLDFRLRGALGLRNTSQLPSKMQAAGAMIPQEAVWQNSEAPVERGECTS